MKIQTYSIDGPILFQPDIYETDRGHFKEAFRSDVFEFHVGGGYNFVQTNQSLSKRKGTVRGLHFQSPPHVQGKLVYCLTGSIIDVVVDARTGSQTYGQFIRVAMSAEQGGYFWVPPGFLHGFSTQEDNVIVRYKCTEYYAPDHAGSVSWDDPDLAIDWAVLPEDAILSDKDRTAVPFNKFVSPFSFKRV